MAKLIDGEKLLAVIEEHCYTLCDRFNSTDKGMFLCGIKQAINEQPTVDTERHAHWGIWDEDTNTYECSNCKNPFTLLEGTPEQNTYFYCPYCGCRMDEVINNE